jgi:hypothetical protein
MVAIGVVAHDVAVLVEVVAQEVSSCPFARGELAG